MERESIFLVILIFLLISLTIYEAFRDTRGMMVLGRRPWETMTKSYMASPVGGDGYPSSKGYSEPFTNWDLRGDIQGASEKNDDASPSTKINMINGTLLPPITEYKEALRLAIFAHLNAISRVSQKSAQPSLLAVIKGFAKYFDKAYSRFMFTANSKGHLNAVMVPTEDPIDYEDLGYYLRSHNCPITIKKIKGIPDAMSFKKMGRDVTGARYVDGKITNPGTADLPLELPQYNRLREVYTGPEDRFDSMAYTLVYIYHSLGGLGNNGSVPIGLLNDDDGEDLGVIELFGSPLNTQSRKGYCSPFTVEREFFSSLGSFYEYTLVPGNLYTCNPPYIDGMMEDAAKRVVERLRDIISTSETSETSETSSTDVFFVFPVWDKDGLERIGDPKKDDDPNADERYGCLDVLRESGLVRAEKILHKDAHKYYSWYGDRLVAYSHTYVFVLSTSEQPRIKLDEYLSRWDALIAKKEQSGSFGSRLEVRR
jgi:hypothetical protein